MINQLTKAIYDAQDQGRSTIDLGKYFSEYSLPRKDKKEAFAWAGYGRTLEGKLYLRDKGAPINVVITIALSENHSVMPATPDSDQGENGVNGSWYFYKYNYQNTGNPGMPALQINGFVPTNTAYNRYANFIWGR